MGWYFQPPGSSAIFATVESLFLDGMGETRVNFPGSENMRRCKDTQASMFTHIHIVPITQITWLASCLGKQECYVLQHLADAGENKIR